MTGPWLWLATAVRCLGLLVIVIPACALAARSLRQATRPFRRLSLIAAGIPFFFPELLTGYTYGQFTRLTVTGFWMRELWFDLLLAGRLFPLGVLVFALLPENHNYRTAHFCRQLAAAGRAVTLGSRISGQLGDWSLWLHTAGRPYFLTAAVLFLAAYQEFELASLLAVPTWTVWLFDAQTGGWDWRWTLVWALPPAAISAVVCGWGWALRFRGEETSAGDNSECQTNFGLSRLCLWGGLSLSWALWILVPLWFFGRMLPTGCVALWNNTPQWSGLWRMILLALGYGLLGGLCADALARGCRSTALPLRIPCVGLALLGLCGVLPLSLAAVGLFQISWLNPLYDTVLPVWIVLGIWLAPRVWLLQVMWDRLVTPASDFSARLLEPGTRSQQRAAARLEWTMQGSGRFWQRSLACHWAYWDLTAATLLQSAGLQSAPVRLYQDMHFGRNAILTAKACLTALVPVLICGVLWWWCRRSQADLA